MASLIGILQFGRWISVVYAMRKLASDFLCSLFTQSVFLVPERLDAEDHLVGRWSHSRVSVVFICF